MKKKLFSSIITLILMLTSSVFSEDVLKSGVGFYYIELKKVSPKKANGELLNQIKNSGWSIVHTVNIDKTVKIKTFYKTHLLCNANTNTEKENHLKAFLI